MPICPNCGNQAADNALFCDQCGTKLPIVEPEPVQETVVEAPVGGVPEDVLICPDCGAENVPGEVFCDVCGNPLEAPMPVTGPTIVEEAVEAEPVVEQVEELIEAELVIEQVEEEGLYCPTCGAEVHAGDTFCGNCGAALGEVEVPLVEPILEEAEVEEQPIEEVVIEEIVVEEEPLEEAVIEEEPLEEVVIEEVVIEEEPLEEVVIEEEPVAEALRCHICGASVLPDQAFCASCGAALQPVEEVTPELAAEPEPEIAPALVTAAGPFIEIADTGAHIPLIDQPELLIGRVDEISGIYPDIDMTPHGGEEGGVSRRHARLIYEGDAWFVIDLDSTNGTYLNGVELAPKTRNPLNDGDRMSLGDVEIIFHTQ